MEQRTVVIRALVDAFDGITKIIKLDTLPMKFCFDLQLSLVDIENAVNTFNNQKLLLLQRYGKESSTQPGFWEMTKDNLNSPIFEKEYNDLLVQTVELKLPSISSEIVLQVPKGLSALDLRALMEVGIITQ